MRYDVLKRVIKKRFVMLLINLKNCKINECEKVDEKIKRLIKKLIVIVKRDRRENEINCFDRETIFVHNIDFRDVVNKKTNEKTSEKAKEVNEKNEKCFLI